MANNDLTELPGAQVSGRTELENCGSLAFRRSIPQSERLIDEHDNDSIRHAAVSLVELENVYLWGSNQNMCLYDALDGVYKELSLEHAPVDWNIAVGTPVVEVSGTTALFPHLDPHNYYHWLIDTIPCFGVLERSGIDTASIDQFYIHRMVNEFQQAMLDTKGVIASKVIYQKEIYAHYRFERLLIPDFRLHGGGWPNPWGARYLRQYFAPQNADSEPVFKDASEQRNAGKPASQKQKVYIARGPARRCVLNEDELIVRLETLGYRIVRPHDLTFEQQVTAMLDADFVLASHGAGLANIVFCRPGIQLMEFCGHYITVHFRMLAEYCGADYRAIAAGLDDKGNRLSVSSLGEVRNDDFIADLDEIVEQAERFSDEAADYQIAV